MAALRPEPEGSLDTQCNNCDFLDEKRKEVEGDDAAEEAPESEKDLAQESTDAKETRESAETLNNSSVHTGFERNGESKRESASAVTNACAEKHEDVSQDKDYALVWSESEEELDSRTCSLSGREGTGELQLACLL